MAKSQSLVTAVRNCDDSVFFIFIEHKQKNKQLQLKTDYNNKTRYSSDINNTQRSLKNNQNIKLGEIYELR